MSESYASYLEECFQGEVYGEAFYRTLAERIGDADAARKLRVLEQLERETKELLRGEVREIGLAGEDDGARADAGAELAGKLAAAPWRALVKGFRVELEKIADRFARSESLAPPGKEWLLRHVTAHERAQVEFTLRELAGEPDPLAPVVALLRGRPAA